MDQNKILAALINKDDKNLSHKEIFKELVTKSDCNETRTQNHLFCKRTLNHSAKVERFKDIVELTNGIKPDDLIYYFNGSTTKKIFDDFDNAIKLFKKIKSGDMMLEY